MPSPQPMTPMRAVCLRWSNSILSKLASKDPLTFSGLFEATRATPAALSTTLKHLLAFELVTQNVFSGAYSITDKGSKALWVAAEFAAMYATPDSGTVTQRERAPGERFIESSAARPSSWDD